MLDPDTGYDVQVRAVNQLKTGPWPETLAQTTGNATACVDPDLTGRNNLWSGTLTVGEAIIRKTQEKVGWGYEPRNGEFTNIDAAIIAGDNSYMIGDLFMQFDYGKELDILIGPSSGTLVLNLNRDLTTADRADLRLHVCDLNFNFSDATRPKGYDDPDPPGSTTVKDIDYYWEESGITWTAEAERLITFSTPAAAQSKSDKDTEGSSSTKSDSDGDTKTKPQAQFKDLPESHDDTSAFTIELHFHFSHEPAEGFSYRTVQNKMFTLSGGAVERAWRLKKGGDLRWGITIQPDGTDAVTVTTRETTGCDTPPGICDRSGRLQTGGPAANIAGPPTLSVADAQVTRGANTPLVFTVTLSRALSSPVTVHYATSDDTAGSDYTSTPGTLTFGANTTTRTVSVPVINNQDGNGTPETLTLTLSNIDTASFIARLQPAGSIPFRLYVLLAHMPRLYPCRWPGPGRCYLPGHRPQCGRIFGTGSAAARGYPPALAGHRDGNVDALSRRDNPDYGRLRGVPRGVGQQVADYLDNAPPVRRHQRQVAAVGGEEDHRHIGDVEDAPHQLDAVGAGQHHVEQDQVGPVLLHQRESLLRVGSHYRGVAGLGRRFPNVTQRLGIVVHHEDRLPLRLTMPRNSALRRSTSSSGAMSCRVTTTDSTSPSSDRMGVALSSTVMFRPSGTSITISSASTSSLLLRTSARGDSRRDKSLPSERRIIMTFRRCSGNWSGSRRTTTFLLASRLNDTGAPVRMSKTTTPTGEVLIRVSKSVLVQCSSRCRKDLHVTETCTVRPCATSLHQQPKHALRHQAVGRHDARRRSPRRR